MEAVKLFRTMISILLSWTSCVPELDGSIGLQGDKETPRQIPDTDLSARGEEYDKIHGFEIGIGRLCGKNLFIHRKSL
jgi:hypothetical protein